jgi:hypothetical protein
MTRRKGDDKLRRLVVATRTPEISALGEFGHFPVPDEKRRRLQRDIDFLLQREGCLVTTHLQGLFTLVLDELEVRLALVD